VAFKLFWLCKRQSPKKAINSFGIDVVHLYQTNDYKHFNGKNHPGEEGLILV
jgi:hypothetical protein